MKIRTFVVGLALFAANAATAMPIHEGKYHLTDAKAGSHGIWFNSAISAGGGSDNTLNIVSATFTSTGGVGTLEGSAQSATLGGGFTFKVVMSYLCTGPGSAACPSYVLDPQPYGTVPSSVDQEKWDFYEWDSPSVLTGFGNLAGLDVTVVQKPTDGRKPFRFGIGADWFNADMLGGSGWFKVTDVVNAAQNVSFTASAGDFNVKAVPEPGTLALLGAGLLGLAWRRRRT